MNETRISNIESSVVFQDRTIEDLSEVIHRQQHEIDDLKLKYAKVMARLDSAEQPSEAGGGEQVVEIPPHY